MMLSEKLRHLRTQVGWFLKRGLLADVEVELELVLDALADQAECLEQVAVPQTARAGGGRIDPARHLMTDHERCSMSMPMQWFDALDEDAQAEAIAAAGPNVVAFPGRPR